MVWEDLERETRGGAGGGGEEGPNPASGVSFRRLTSSPITATNFPAFCISTRKQAKA